MKKNVQSRATSKRRKKLRTLWYDDCRIAVADYSDRYNPSQANLYAEIGLRSDGVVMWRKLKERK